MNDGLLDGFARKSHRDVGKYAYGLDITDPSYRASKSFDAIDASPDVCAAYPYFNIEERVVPNNFYVQSIVWTGSEWVAINGTQCTTSTDLISWTAPVSLPSAGTGNHWAKIGWNGSRLVIASQQRYVAGAGAGDGFIRTGYSDTHGASWSTGTAFSLSITSSGTETSPIVWTGGAFLFTNSSVGGIFRSTDGATWTRLMTSTTAFIGIATDGAGTAFAVTEAASAVLGNLYSNDHGATWANVVRGGGGSMFYDTAESMYAVNLINYENALPSSLSYSTTGLTWTDVSTASTVDLISADKVLTTPHYVVIIINSLYISIFNKALNNQYVCLPRYTATKTPYYRGVYANNVMLLYPGIQADFNTPGQSFNIGILTIDQSRARLAPSVTFTDLNLFVKVKA